MRGEQEMVSLDFSNTFGTGSHKTLVTKAGYWGLGGRVDGQLEDE